MSTKDDEPMPYCHSSTYQTKTVQHWRQNAINITVGTSLVKLTSMYLPRLYTLRLVRVLQCEPLPNFSNPPECGPSSIEVKGSQVVSFVMSTPLYVSVSLGIFILYHLQTWRLMLGDGGVSWLYGKAQSTRRTFILFKVHFASDVKSNWKRTWCIMSRVIMPSLVQQLLDGPEK